MSKFGAIGCPSAEGQDYSADHNQSDEDEHDSICQGTALVLLGLT